MGLLLSSLLTDPLIQLPGSIHSVGLKNIILKKKIVYSIAYFVLWFQ